MPCAEQVAASLAAAGVSVEVLDLGSPEEWEKGPVLETVRKTSKVLVLELGP